MKKKNWVIIIIMVSVVLILISGFFIGGGSPPRYSIGGSGNCVIAGFPTQSYRNLTKMQCDEINGTYYPLY
jgi:hypothetical protein